MEKLKLSITLDSDYQTVPPRAKIKIADKTIFEGKVEGPVLVVQQLELESDASYQLTIELLDKKPEHTEINEQGNVVKDSLLKINRVVLEDIEIQNSFSTNKEKFYYEHSNEKHQLYNTLGINGTAVINFTTPFYVWLLETI